MAKGKSWELIHNPGVKLGHSVTDSACDIGINYYLKLLLLVYKWWNVNKNGR